MPPPLSQFFFYFSDGRANLNAQIAKWFENNSLQQCHSNCENTCDNHLLYKQISSNKHPESLFVYTE